MSERAKSIAPELRWLGNEPVVVGGPIPDHPHGHVHIWRFVNGSAADANPDELQEKAYWGTGASGEKQEA